MTNNFKSIFVLVLLFSLLSCKQQQARMPISRSSGTFMKESIIRNKKLIAGEEGKIDSIIKSNPTIQYIPSKKGYWYHYDLKNDKDTLRPKKGDIVQFDYEIKENQQLEEYSSELKKINYFCHENNYLSP